jgi:hypothetical protein
MKVRQLIFRRKKKRKTPAELYKGVSAYCSKHPFTARCMCNKCIICIEEETGFLPGSLTYSALPDSGLCVCNECLKIHSEEELAEFYAMFSTKYWETPVSKEVVLATLIKKPSRETITRFIEDGQFVCIIKDLDSGIISKNVTHVSGIARYPGTCCPEPGCDNDSNRATCPSCGASCAECKVRQKEQP